MIRAEVANFSFRSRVRAFILTVLTDYSRRAATSGYRCDTPLGCWQAMGGEGQVPDYCPSNSLSISSIVGKLPRKSVGKARPNS